MSFRGESRGVDPVEKAADEEDDDEDEDDNDKEDGGQSVMNIEPMATALVGSPGRDAFAMATALRESEPLRLIVKS